MTHTDTPETDKWTGLRHYVRELAETSRRLERERNEARAIAAHWRDTAAGEFAHAAPLPWESQKNQAYVSRAYP